MMDLATAVITGVLAITGPSGEPVPGAVEQRAQVRCRPAPYIISDRLGDRPKPHKALLTGSRVPIRIYPEERRTRPCHLMNGPGEVEPKLLKIADTQ
jgi:hypothetical protein